jgi:hypothetical protein
LQLPRAICDAEGIPEKGQKSSAVSVFKSLYPEAFTSTVKQTVPHCPTALIIDAMFIINYVPLSVHKVFSEYAKFLFDRWVVRPHKLDGATEVHMIFDDPNRHGMSPKDIERCRRDNILIQDSDFSEINSDTSLPSNWHSFISVRKQKRLLINFLSEHFLHIANLTFQKSECFFVTAGGFNNRRDEARCATNGSSAEYLNASGVHEEADTRLWLHAAASTAQIIFIYSPDTDVFFIGLPLMKKLNKSVTVQLKDSPYESVFVNMNKLVQFLHSDLFFQALQNIEECILMVYISSGCDFVSFCKGYGKTTFLDIFRKHAAFITGSQYTGHLNGVNTDGGLLAFYRLVSSVYFYRYCSAFQPLSTPKALFDSFNTGNTKNTHLLIISDIREKQWERVTNYSKP